MAEAGRRRAPWNSSAQSAGVMGGLGVIDWRNSGAPGMKPFNICISTPVGARTPRTSGGVNNSYLIHEFIDWHRGFEAALTYHEAGAAIGRVIVFRPRQRALRRRAHGWTVGTSAEFVSESLPTRFRG